MIRPTDSSRVESQQNVFSVNDFSQLFALQHSIQEDIRQGKFIFWEDVIYLWYSVDLKCYFTEEVELENVPSHYSKIMWGFFFPIAYTEEQIVYRLTLLNSIYWLELTDWYIEQLTYNILN